MPALRETWTCGFHQVISSLPTGNGPNGLFENTEQPGAFLPASPPSTMCGLGEAVPKVDLPNHGTWRNKGFKQLRKS